jgi:hypothetical protein
MGLLRRSTPEEELNKRLAREQREFEAFMDEFTAEALNADIKDERKELTQAEKERLEILHKTIESHLEILLHRFFLAYRLMAFTRSVRALSPAKEAEEDRQIVTNAMKSRVLQGFHIMLGSLHFNLVHIQHDEALKGAISDLIPLFEDTAAFVKNKFLPGLENGWNGEGPKQMIKDVRNKYTTQYHLLANDIVGKYLAGPPDKKFKLQKKIEAENKKVEHRLDVASEAAKQVFQ